MTKDELKRMMSLVDEKYIDEMTQDFPEASGDFEDFEAAEIEHGIVQEAPRSGWRIWAAMAAAVVLCVPIGFSMANGFRMQPEDISVGTSVQTDWAALVDSMSDEEVDSYFTCGTDTVFPAFSGTISQKIQTDAVPFASAYEGKQLTIYDNWSTAQIRDSVTGELLMDSDNAEGRMGFGVTVTTETNDIAFEVLLMNNAAPLEIEAEPAYLPKFEDVAFYGRYREHPTQDGMEGNCFFQMGTTTYEILTDTLSKRELLTIVYEVLASGATPESIDALYQAEVTRLEMLQAENHHQEAGIEDEIRQYTQADLAEINEMDFCNGWIPQSRQVGSLHYIGYTLMGGEIPDGINLIYRNDGMEAPPDFELQFLTREYGDQWAAQIEDAAAIFSINEFSSEAVNAIVKEQENGMPLYIFMVDLGDCWMHVNAECAPEDMESFVQIMSEIIEAKTNVVNKYEPDMTRTFEEELAYLNSLDFCEGWIPQNLREIGGMDDLMIGIYNEDEAGGTRVDEYVHMTYRDTSAYNHYLEVDFYPAEFWDASETEMEPVYPSWDMETIANVRYCQEHINGLHKYAYYAELDNCVMVVSGQTTAMEMQTFVNTMSLLLNQNCKAEEGSQKKVLGWFYHRDMIELQNLQTFKNWIPELTRIGNMAYGGRGYSMTEGKDNHADISWQAFDLSHNYELTAAWYSKDYSTMYEFVNPVITPDDWNMETISTSTYCTDEETVYQLDKIGAVHVYKYAFQIDWGDCIMTVDAECTPEEMEIFVNSMSELYAQNQN